MISTRRVAGAYSVSSGMTKTAKANEADAPPKQGTSEDAERLIAEGTQSDFNRLGASLHDDRSASATQAARVLSEIAQQKPEALTPIVERIASAVSSDNKRVVAAAAEALPRIAQVAPARIAKQLEKLKAAYAGTNDAGKDGIVRTFAALCAASVAYQKRLEPALKTALAGADPKTLATWTEIVLPALKGEPHANARAVVERRLPTLPRGPAQKIAGFLGIKLPRRR